MLAGKIGAFAVNSRFSEFLSCGFELALTHRLLDPENFVYIDPGPLQIERSMLLKNHPGSKKSLLPIKFTKSEISSTLSLIRKRVKTTMNMVAAYYIKDDYIGNDSLLQSRIIDLIHSIAPDHPVIQGYGMSLDYDKNRDGNFAPAFSTRQHFTNAELLVFDPAIDGVLPYIYSLHNQEPISDYAMANLLPWMLEQFKEHGYTDKHFMIGGVHAWAGPKEVYHPTAVQIAIQSQAFALAGATAVCAFTWQNFPLNSQPQLANTDSAGQEMRSGLIAGGKLCREVWDRKVSKPDYGEEGVNK